MERVACAILGTAIILTQMAWGQSVKPLEYSRKAMRFAYDPDLGTARGDTIRISNTNGASIDCDSIILLTGKEPHLWGMFLFESLVMGSTDQGFSLFPGGGSEKWDSVAGIYRSSFPFSRTKLAFPAGKQIGFAWSGYDACPVCKRSAQPSSGDSAVFRMVFKYGRLQDTLRMSMDKRYTTGIKPHTTVNERVEGSGRRPLWDVLGRQNGHRVRIH